MPHVVIPPEAYEHHNLTGLVPAARCYEPIKGRPLAKAFECLTPWLQQTTHGRPKVEVYRSARWCLNALAGGYAKPLGRDAMLTDAPVPGIYATLMAGLESAVAYLDVVSNGDARMKDHYARSGDAIYRTSMPGYQPTQRRMRDHGRAHEDWGDKYSPSPPRR
jgi:hypothetical protein